MKVKIFGTNKDDSINILDGTHDPFLEYEIHGLNGSDSILGGFLDDEIYGNQGDDNLEGLFGADYIDGGNGDDRIFGINEGDPNPGVFPSGVFFLFGNTLLGGNGNDLLVGYSFISVSRLEDDEHIDIASIGSNELYGGNGNDILVGINATNNITAEGLTSRITEYTQRANYLEGGKGNDLLIGSFDLITQTTKDIPYQNVVANLEGSTLLGGAGDDTLIGSDNYFEYTHINIGGGRYIYNYGDSYLNGGDGNDILVGNVFTSIVTIVDSPDFIVEDHYGDDILIGGKGNDQLWGDVVVHDQVDALEFFGSDTFQFSLDGKFNNDTIFDLNAGGVSDILKFTDVSDVNGDMVVDENDVEDSVLQISANANNDVLISFAGGSITLAGVDYTGQDSLAVLDVIVIAEM